MFFRKSKDTLSTVKPFKAFNHTFRCWITDDGHRYEWRSTDGKCFAGKVEGEGKYWARANGRQLAVTYQRLSEAMVAASTAAR